MCFYRESNGLVVMISFSKKLDIRKERQSFEEAIEQFRGQHDNLMKQLRTQKKDIEQALKQMKDQVLRSQRLYEELVLRKESRLYVEHMNDKALKRVLDCLAETEADGWELVAKKDKGEVVVYRKLMAGLDGVPSRFCCVKVGGY